MGGRCFPASRVGRGMSASSLLTAATVCQAHSPGTDSKLKNFLPECHEDWLHLNARQTTPLPQSLVTRAWFILLFVHSSDGSRVSSYAFATTVVLFAVDEPPENKLLALQRGEYVVTVTPHHYGDGCHHYSAVLKMPMLQSQEFCCKDSQPLQL